jgi:serine/threonine-protein kinase RsbW
VNAHSGQFEVVIQSDYESGQAIVERIMSAIENCGFSTRDTFGIRLAVDEAVINAIKHGNRFSPDKTVRIDFQSNDRGVRVEIEDQGSGFQPEDVPDPTADENLERPCGRGLMLMREFMTRIEFNSKGNMVVLEKLHSS